MHVDNPRIQQKATINPYRYGFHAIAKRMAWDINPESWRSRRLLKAWRDKYPGDKAVIVCNGPSLLKSDLHLLHGVFAFGLNKINLLFENRDFRPSCVVAVNHLVIEQNADFFNTTSTPLFLEQGGRHWIKARENVAFLHSADQTKFARDCSVSIQQGFTVTYVAMQLAFHMGFRRVALIGCDHNSAETISWSDWESRRQKARGDRRWELDFKILKSGRRRSAWPWTFIE
jgi:hypothetical protein